MSEEQNELNFLGIGVWVKTLKEYTDDNAIRKAGEIGIIGDISPDLFSEDAKFTTFQVVFNTPDEDGDYFWCYDREDLEIITRPTLVFE